LILEDDAWLTPSIKQIVEALEGDLQQLPVDVVLLSECITAAGTIWNKGLYFLSPVKHAYFGHAYVMTLRGANILTRHLYPIRHQADAWNWLLKHRLVRVAAIHPVMATQNQEMLESTNLGRQGGAVSPYSRSWWLRKLWRACWRLHDTCVPLRWHHGQAKTVMEEAIQECVDGSGARTGKR
jgi:GR25 family glycosyltransferase involved in LPS biosynthesis